MATNCAKCGAELIGSRKFCTACGTPVADPRALGGPASGGGAPVSVVSGADAAAVNPFAVTAPPNTMSPVAVPSRSSNYGPPPGQAIVTPATPMTVPPELLARVALSETETDPKALPMLPATPGGPISAAGAASAGAALPPLSPLAISSLMPTADDKEAAEAARARVRQAEVAQANKAPGTQMMPSVPRPGQAGPVSAGTPSVGAQATPSKRQDRTQLLAAMPPGVPRPPTPLPGAAAPPAVRPAPPSTSKMAAAPVAAGSSPSGPGSLPGDGRGSNPPPQAYGQPPRSALPGQPPSAPYAPPPQAGAAPPAWSQPLPPSGYGWSQPQPPQQPPPPSAYGAPPAYGAGGYGGFGYQPGARVVVTWSTGQRFPATVQQVTANQCLVVFPDGQQHWVDMQYVAPA